MANPLQYSCLGNPTDRRAWWDSPWGRKRVRRDLVTEKKNNKLFLNFKNNNSPLDV